MSAEALPERPTPVSQSIFSQTYGDLLTAHRAERCLTLMFRQLAGLLPGYAGVLWAVRSSGGCKTLTFPPPSS
jgi:hypothetical protein